MSYILYSGKIRGCNLKNLIYYFINPKWREVVVKFSRGLYKGKPEWKQEGAQLAKTDSDGTLKFRDKKARF